MISTHDVREDLLRNNGGEADIDRAIEQVRVLHKNKALPYYELMCSRQHGGLRYLLAELNDKYGTILITDLTTQHQHKYTNDTNPDDGKELR